MGRLSALAILGIVLGSALGAGCAKKIAATSEPTEAQIAELQRFGRELWAEYGSTQPPIDTWVRALPWLKFQRVVLRDDGAYFIMDETGADEIGYAVVDNVGAFLRQHPGADNRILDTFVMRYRIPKP